MFSTFGLLYVQIPLWTTVLYIIYRLYWELSTEAYDRHRAKERGCEPPKVRRSSFWGLSLIITNAKFLKNHTILENGHKEFERYNGRTLLIRFLGKRILSTNEPDNVQSILATDFNSWSIGVNRKPFIPLLGEGIFASDGAAWRHSRDLLRPNFNRAQVADVDLFERHIGHLFRVIPHDGSTVDLQPLFFRLSMDISTEFLFGQSTNDLAAARSSPETARFVESWNRCTTNLVGGGRIGYLSAFFTDPQFTRDCKVVHGKMLSFLIPVTQGPEQAKTHTDAPPNRLRRLHNRPRPLLPLDLKTRLLRLLLKPLHIPRPPLLTNLRPHQNPHRTPQRPPRRSRNHRLPPLQPPIHPLPPARHPIGPPPRNPNPLIPRPRSRQVPQISPCLHQRVPENVPHPSPER